MKVTNDEIKDLIKQYVAEYTKVIVDDDDQNLFCAEYGIVMPDFLYVFRALEEKLSVPVAKVLEQRDYTVFTVNNLSKAIVEDFSEITQ